MYKSLVALALLAAATGASAEPWKYSGSLNDGGAPANGRYDLRLTLLDATKAMLIGSPVTLHAVDVQAGAFTVEVDFGIDLANAPAMQLKIEVSKGSSGFVVLGEPTRFDPKAALAGVCWDTEGNSGTNPTTNFLGTTDDQPLVIRAGGVQAFRIFPTAQSPNLVAGWNGNSVDATKAGQVVAGGGLSGNSCGPTLTSTCQNRTQSSLATVSGGQGNTASNVSSTIGGGSGNTAGGDDSTVGGGRSNTTGNFGSTIGGGIANTASGTYSTVSGGSSNCAGGDYSWAGGQSAKIRPGNEPGDGNCSTSSGTATGDNGTFVWADDENATFVSTGPRQFLVRAAGGVMFNTNSLINIGDDVVIAARPAIGGGDADSDLTWKTRNNKTARVYVSDSSGTFVWQAFNLSAEANFFTMGNGASLSNGGTWTNASSRSLKSGFAAIDPIAMLDKLIALPITSWAYKGSLEGTHVGPVAEDFKAAFGLAGDGKSISTVDADGVALAAIQGLNQKLEIENAALRARLDALEAKVMP